VQALLLGAVPGLAHVLVLERAGTGTVLFVLFILGADAVVTGRFLLLTDYAGDLITWGARGATAVWVLAFADVLRLVLFRDYEARARLRAALCAEGIRLYVRDDLGGARKAFRRCLSLDERDADALFWYGCVEARRGKARRARRAFRRCLKHDVEGKWAWECEEQLRRLAGGPGVPPLTGGPGG